jgi:hypothetical protein
MKNRTTKAVGALIAAATVLAGVAAAAPAAATPSTHASSPSPAVDVDQHLASAAYITPTNPSWDQLIATGSRLGFVVVNVYNGPGTAPTPEWTSLIQRVHAAGIKVLGYVDTGYLGGSDPVRYTRAGDTDPTNWIAQAEQDVNAWYGFYGGAIDGIFFDDVMNTCGPTAGSDEYAKDYRFLSSTVHTAHPGSLTVLNPGITVPQCYEDAGDVLLTFEGPASDFLNPPADLAPLPWQAKADPAKFWNIVYGVDAAQLGAVMTKGKKDNVGYMYATPDTLPNPYDTIPDASYWAQEAAVAAAASTSTPARVAGVAAVGTSATDVTVGWLSDGARDLAGYDVYSNGLRVASVGRDQGHGRVFGVTVHGLTSGKPYSFDVRARSLSGGVSAPSRTVTARTWPAWGTAPTTPGSVALSEVAAGSVRLSWGASTSPGGIAGYDVYQDGAKILSMPASVLSVRVTGLALGAHVGFSVQARGVNGKTSAMSATAAADIPNPLPITDASVTFGPETTTFQARFNVGFSFDHVFIDSDSSLATGYQFGGVGAEYMIENGTLYRNADDSNTWNWQPVALETGPLMSTTGGLYVWQVPSSEFGASTSMTVVFNGGGSYPDYTLAPITATKQ